MGLKPGRYKTRKTLIRREKRIGKGTDRAYTILGGGESWFPGKLVTPLSHRGNQKGNREGPGHSKVTWTSVLIKVGNTWWHRKGGQPYFATYLIKSGFLEIVVVNTRVRFYFLPYSFV